MTLGPFTIGRTKSLDLEHKTSLAQLASVVGWRGWWPLLREATTGGWQRNEEIAIDTVLSNPTLYAVITLICGDIAKLRPMLVEEDDDGIETEVGSGKSIGLLTRPNPYQDWVDYVEWYMLSKLVHGNTYVLKARDARGVVKALYILDPLRVRPLIGPDGSVFYALYPDQLTPQLTDTSPVVPAREMIHDVMCPLFHPLLGVSPIYAAGFPAMQGLNIRGASDSFFKNGSRPGGVLLVPGTLTQTQVDTMKTNWKASFSGDNQGDIAVLTGGMKYEAMAMTAEQARLVEQLQMTDEDIAKCFHMPRHKVGIGPDPTYNNIDSLNVQYYTDCLQKHTTKFQNKHTEGLELGNVSGKTLAIRLDLDGLRTMDMAATADAASKAVYAGMSYNEARYRFWKLGPVSGGEAPLAQQQNYSLPALARRDASPDPFATVRETYTAPATAPAPVPVGDGAAQQKGLDLVALHGLVQRKVLELRAA